MSVEVDSPFVHLSRPNRSLGLAGRRWVLVAIASTKIPILLGHGYWLFAASASKPGLLSMLHEARTDLSMLLCCAFLLVVGGGRQSLDARLAQGAN